MTKHGKPNGKIINLQRGRGTRLRPLGPCELTIVPEIRGGKVRIRVWGPDGVEVQHFRMPPDSACNESPG